MTRKTIGHPFYTAISFVRKIPIRTKVGDVCAPCDLKFDRWKDNRGLLYFVKLCVSFQSHRRIQTGATIRKRSIRVKRGDFLSHVNLKFDWCTCEIVGHLFCAISRFVHHFIAVSEFKLELPSGNANLPPNWLFHVPCVQYGIHSSFVHHIITIGVFILKLQSRNSQLWSNDF